MILMGAISVSWVQYYPEDLNFIGMIIVFSPGRGSAELIWKDAESSNVPFQLTHLIFKLLSSSLVK